MEAPNTYEPKSFVSFMHVMKWAAGDYQQCSTIKKWVRVMYTVVQWSVNMNNTTQGYYPILRWNADDSNNIVFCLQLNIKIIKKCKMPVINLRFFYIFSNILIDNIVF